MEEKDILLKTIEGLNASIASLSATNKDQAEQIKNLQERIKELTAQIAWLNRQLFGRKTEKLPIYSPDMPDLFAVTKVGIFSKCPQNKMAYEMIMVYHLHMPFFIALFPCILT